ncbi:hypothetical protein [Lentilactobacillus hilgardii]|uniref:hypothetical protein n=1 Tax=Lentilactobacillus hilgardii TaxID=1588 RepID=UPI0021A5911C|nr:hypothetical protein [Lentilactobacillus hilgardii]MCT3396234.1 hypothetical protein [Lentilactobacillus hilgardii]MCT3398112.1 hypothetical protein [Lentilactobacillus hilgardii]
MAIYHNGIKIKNLYHNGKKIEVLYHNGIKIYQGKYDAGTALATVGKSLAPNSSDPFGADIGDKYNEHFVSNGTFPFDISKIDNGIQINSSHSDSISSQIANAGYLVEADYYSGSPSWTNPIKISKSDLIAGTKVEISKGTTSSYYIPIYAQYKNGALSITGVSSEGGKEEHTTCYSWEDQGFSGYVFITCEFMRIDSITTY